MPSVHQVTGPNTTFVALCGAKRKNENPSLRSILKGFCFASEVCKAGVDTHAGKHKQSSSSVVSLPLEWHDNPFAAQQIRCRCSLSEMNRWYCPHHGNHPPNQTNRLYISVLFCRHVEQPDAVERGAPAAVPLLQLRPRGARRDGHDETRRRRHRLCAAPHPRTRECSFAFLVCVCMCVCCGVGVSVFVCACV